MNINSILIATASLGTMGLLFGAGLALASQKFAVEVDPKVTEIENALPGANCGACGYPGCSAFAKAVAAGNAPVNGCPVGGPETADLLGEVMGLVAEETDKMIARVLCKGGDACQDRFIYDGIKECAAENLVSGGAKACTYGCLGDGSCVTACPFDAIFINEHGVAEVIKEKCVACGKCIEVCPKNIIEMVPFEQETFVDCMNTEIGGHVKKNCSNACISCKLCEKACNFDAIKVENNIARIDYDKCVDCMECSIKCPTGAITADLEKRKVAEVVEENCIGCTICAKKCPVDAIEGNLKEIHKVDPDKCIGCGVCYDKCPKDAIIMK